ncbi:hypothetical protein D3C75_1105020 [compost metagenome]
MGHILVFVLPLLLKPGSNVLKPGQHLLHHLFPALAGQQLFQAARRFIRLARMTRSGQRLQMIDQPAQQAPDIGPSGSGIRGDQVKHFLGYRPSLL